MLEKDIRIVPNDLEIYFKDFEVAFKHKNIDDAIMYLNNMKKRSTIASNLWNRLEKELNNRTIR